MKVLHDMHSVLKKFMETGQVQDKIKSGRAENQSIADEQHGSLKVASQPFKNQQHWSSSCGV